jgi:WD40 repeat protein
VPRAGLGDLPLFLAAFFERQSAGVFKCFKCHQGCSLMRTNLRSLGTPCRERVRQSVEGGRLRSPVRRPISIVQTVGPFANSVRPFTVNGAGTLIYANVNDLLGFQIGDVKTGKVLHTVAVQGYGWSRERLTGHGCPSHGVALSPDEKEVWVTDGANSRVHIFDNTVMPPKQMMSVQLRDEPFWLTFSADGKWVYSSFGDIVDAQ